MDSMYAYIKGELAEKNIDSIVVEAAGVGYLIYIPTQYFDMLPDEGEDVKIYTYLCVREDAMILYGFLSKETAQRVILDLKDKLSLEDAFEKKLENQVSGAAVSMNSSVKNDAVMALNALGYSSTESLKAVSKVDITEDMDVEDVLKLALKNMG